MADGLPTAHLIELADALRAGRLSRRDFIRHAAALGLSLPAIAALLAACGASATPTALAPTARAAATTAATTVPAGTGATVAAVATQGATAVTGAATPGAGQPKRGGEIIIGTLGEAQTINPFLVNESEGTWRCKMLFDEFVTLDPKTFEPKPALAKSWTLSPDGKEYIFTLQDNVKFADGKPLTMDDIAFFLQGVLKKETTSPFVPQFTDLVGADEYNKGTASTIGGIQVVDPKTLKLQLKAPNAAFLVNLRNVRPVPKAALEGKSLKDDPFFQNPVGAGPFKFVSWKNGGDFVAERNPNYWQPGKPYLDKFTHRVIADSQTLVVALETGEIDASNYPAPTVADQLKKNAGLTILVPPFTTPDGWAFNLQHEALAKKPVRQAIAMAMNMEQFARDFLLGLGKVGVGPIAPDNWAFNRSLKPIPYDLNKAKALMKEAGYPNGGFSITFITNQGNVLREDFLTFTQQALEPLGIKATSGLREWTQVVKGATDGTFEAICPTFSGATIEPDELYNTLFSTSKRNVYHYKNAEVDQLLEQGRVETDRAKRKQAYDRIQEILLDEVPIFWAWYRPFIHVAKKKYAGYVDSNLGGGMFQQLENWYVTG